MVEMEAIDENDNGQWIQSLSYQATEIKQGEEGLFLYIEAILETQGLRSATSKGENTL